MFLVTPSQEFYDTAIDIIRRDEIFDTSKCMSNPEEQVLARVMLELNSPVYNIHQTYNWIVGKNDWLKFSDGRAKVWNYYGKDKPWGVHDWPDFTIWRELLKEVNEVLPLSW
jgi:lipopolysaccharide biosynthesis glycosyltransferase